MELKSKYRIGQEVLTDLDRDIAGVPVEIIDIQIAYEVKFRDGTTGIRLESDIPQLSRSEDEAWQLAAILAGNRSVHKPLHASVEYLIETENRINKILEQAGIDIHATATVTRRSVILSQADQLVRVTP